MFMIKALTPENGLKNDSITDKRVATNAAKKNLYTVKTLYNVTRYNRIFNIRHKSAGNRSVSIKIPSL